MIFLLFLISLFSIGVHAVNVHDCTDIPTLSSNTYYELQNDLSCGLLSFDNLYNVSFNLNGHYYDGSISVITNTHGIEVYNGTMSQDISAGSYYASGIYLHDIYFNGSFSLYNASAESSSSYLENLYFNNSFSNNYFLIEMKNMKMNNVTLTCRTSCDFACEQSRIEMENVKFLGDWNGTTMNYCIIYLRNSSSFPKVNVANSSTLYYMEEGTFKARNNNNYVDAMAVVYSLNGDETGFENTYLIDHNPTRKKHVGLNNGISSDYYAKNATIWFIDGSKKEMNFNQYNVTVKVRDKMQSRLITFNSPAYVEFVFNEKSILDIILEMISRWLG